MSCEGANTTHITAPDRTDYSYCNTEYSMILSSYPRPVTSVDWTSYQTELQRDDRDIPSTAGNHPVLVPIA
jgi:hypothetical protein